MEVFLSSALVDWRLETRYDTNGDRYHQSSQGLECWRPLKRLGNGTFGDVWQERCVSGHKQDTLRAVKQIRRLQPEFSKMSKRELEALVAFSNPEVPEYQHHFVQCFGWFNDEHHLYIAMEFMYFGDLQQYITCRSFPEPEAASIASQVAQGLCFMHESNFVHRDLKPLNILVAEPGPRWHVKLADFGLAKNMDGTILGTQSIGTRGYMAPELIEETTTEYTPAVDVWALGAVVFCMRTRVVPFPSNRQMIDYVYRNKIQLITGPLGMSSGYCIDFVLGAMAAEAEARFTIQQILAHDWLSIHTGVGHQGSTAHSAMASNVWDQVDSNAWSSTISSGNSSSQQSLGSWGARDPSISSASSISSPASSLQKSSDRPSDRGSNPYSQPMGSAAPPPSSGNNTSSYSTMRPQTGQTAMPASLRPGPLRASTTPQTAGWPSQAGGSWASGYETTLQPPTAQPPASHYRTSSMQMAPTYPGRPSYSNQPQTAIPLRESGPPGSNRRYTSYNNPTGIPSVPGRQPVAQGSNPRYSSYTPQATSMSIPEMKPAAPASNSHYSSYTPTANGSVPDATHPGSNPRYSSYNPQTMTRSVPESSMPPASNPQHASYTDPRTITPVGGKNSVTPASNSQYAPYAPPGTAIPARRTSVLPEHSSPYTPYNDPRATASAPRSNPDPPANNSQYISYTDPASAFAVRNSNLQQTSYTNPTGIAPGSRSNVRSSSYTDQAPTPSVVNRKSIPLPSNLQYPSYSDIRNDSIPTKPREVEPKGPLPPSNFAPPGTTVHAVPTGQEKGETQLPSANLASAMSQPQEIYEEPTSYDNVEHYYQPDHEDDHEDDYEHGSKNDQTISPDLVTASYSSHDIEPDYQHGTGQERSPIPDALTTTYSEPGHEIEPDAVYHTDAESETEIDPFLTCLTCSEDFYTRSDLFNHLEDQAHARDPVTKEWEYYERPTASKHHDYYLKCMTCYNNFHSRNDLFAHLEADQHARDLDTNEWGYYTRPDPYGSESDTVDPRLTCLTCYEGFYDRDDLFHHLEDKQHARDLITQEWGRYTRPWRSRGY